MRVIGGEFRSRRLKSIPGVATRPTPDRLRETLFDILQARIRGAVFVDAYAGTGAVGIEAISRGARHAYFLERNPAALDAIRENLDELRIGPRATVLAGPVLLTLARCSGGVVFLDPPYDQAREYTAAMQLISEKAPELAIVQHSVRFQPEDQYGSLHRIRDVRQGDNVLSFYEGQA
jgi:16S rRNA (guanine966-N2)-methyltransferase